jgi:1-acyl-sn-glycerol-3-phosphate acyltransferase
MWHRDRIDCGHRVRTILCIGRDWHLVRFCRSVGRFLKATAIFLYGALELIVKRPATRVLRAEWLHQFSARVLRGMGIAVRVEGTFPRSGIVVSNHLGYLDIVAFAAQHRCVFVSKAELANEFLVGWMTTMAGSVYVDRGRGGSAIRARDDMQAAADAGLPIVIFPEGTTTDGDSVLKFHSGLLGQVVEAGQPVTAAFVRYQLTEDNGPDVSIGNDVCFWRDDISLFQHIFRLLGLRGIEVIVRIADRPIVFSDAAPDRKVVAAEARAAVMELGGLRDAVAAG